MMTTPHRFQIGMVKARPATGPAGRSTTSSCSSLSPCSPTTCSDGPQLIGAAQQDHQRRLIQITGRLDHARGRILHLPARPPALARR
jgi:hypothetical protein